MLHPLCLCVLRKTSVTSVFTSQVPSNADKQPIPDGEKVRPCQTLCISAGMHTHASARQELDTDVFVSISGACLQAHACITWYMQTFPWPAMGTHARTFSAVQEQIKRLLAGLMLASHETSSLGLHQRTSTRLVCCAGANQEVADRADAVHPPSGACAAQRGPVSHLQPRLP